MSGNSAPSNFWEFNQKIGNLVFFLFLIEYSLKQLSLHTKTDFIEIAACILLAWMISAVKMYSSLPKVPGIQKIRMIESRAACKPKRNPCFITCGLPEMTWTKSQPFFFCACDCNLRVKRTSFPSVSVLKNGTKSMLSWKSFKLSHWRSYLFRILCPFLSDMIFKHGASQNHLSISASPLYFVWNLWFDFLSVR